MNPAPESTSATCRQTNDDPRRQLAERTAERDEALAREAAMAEVLGVINASPGDLTTVFNAMLENAISLCGGIQGALWTLDEQRAKVAASYGNTPEFVARLREWAEVGPPEAVRETMRRRLLNIPDLVEDDIYRAGDPIARAAVELRACESFGAG